MAKKTTASEPLPLDLIDLTGYYDNPEYYDQPTDSGGRKGFVDVAGNPFSVEELGVDLRAELEADVQRRDARSNWLKDFGTTALVRGSTLGKPTQEQLERGRGDWRDRGKLFTDAGIAWGLEALGEGLMSRVAGKLIPKLLPESKTLYPTAPKSVKRKTPPKSVTPKKAKLEIGSLQKGSTLERLGKTGSIATGDIKSIIRSDKTSPHDKFILQSVINKKFPNQKRIDYKDFKVAVGEEIVPLNRSRTGLYSDYGTERLGYHKGDPFNEGLDVPEFNTYTFSNKGRFGKGSGKHFDEGTLGHVRTMDVPDDPNSMYVLESQSDFFQEGGGKNLTPENIAKFSERSKRKVSAIEGDIKLLENAEQVTRPVTPGKPEDGVIIEGYNIGKDKHFIDGSSYNRELTRQKEALVKANVELNNFKNPEQKRLLGKNVDERLYQESLQLAQEQGKDKLYYPTRETAAKIEGFKKQSELVPPDPETVVEEVARNKRSAKNYKKSLDEIKNRLKRIETHGFKPDSKTGKYVDADGVTHDTLDDLKKHYKDGLNFWQESYDGALEQVRRWETPWQPRPDQYSPSHETVLKKYDAFPKIAKRASKSKTTIFTDPKGNTWYKVDVPKKRAIKAFELGGFLGAGAALTAEGQYRQQLREYAEGGYLGDIPQFKSGGYLPGDSTPMGRNQVIGEFPIYQGGGELGDRNLRAASDSLTAANSNLPWIQRYQRGNELNIPDPYDPGSGKTSTHGLAYHPLGDGNAMIYPEIVQQGDSLVHRSGDAAREYAEQNNLGINTDLELAKYYSQDGLIQHQVGGFIGDPPPSDSTVVQSDPYEDMFVGGNIEEATVVGVSGATKRERLKNLYDPISNKMFEWFYNSDFMRDKFEGGDYTLAEQDKFVDNLRYLNQAYPMTGFSPEIDQWLETEDISQRNPPPQDDVLTGIQDTLLNIPDDKLWKLMSSEDLGSLKFKDIKRLRKNYTDLSRKDALKTIGHLAKLYKEGYTFAEGGDLPPGATTRPPVVNPATGVNAKQYVQEWFNAPASQARLKALSPENVEGRMGSINRNLEELQYVEPTGPAEEGVSGMYLPEEHTVTSFDQSFPTDVHETFHGTQLADPFTGDRPSQKYIKGVPTTAGKGKLRHPQYPNEVYARIMELRSQTGVTPETVVTPEMLPLQDDRSNELFQYYQDEDIVDMMNTLAMQNQNQQGLPIAQYGGQLMLPQYKGGGGLSRKKDYGSKKKPYPSVSAGNFAGGGRSYPIPTRADAVDALRLAGLHGRSDVRAKVYKKYPGLKKKQDGGEILPPSQVRAQSIQRTRQEDGVLNQGFEDYSTINPVGSPEDRSRLFGRQGTGQAPIQYFSDPETRQLSINSAIQSGRDIDPFLANYLDQRVDNFAGSVAPFHEGGDLAQYMPQGIFGQIAKDVGGSMGNLISGIKQLPQKPIGIGETQAGQEIEALGQKQLGDPSVQIQPLPVEEAVYGYGGNLELPQYGFGSWLGDNAGGLLKGAGSIASAIPPIGTIVGPILSVAGSVTDSVVAGKRQKEAVAEGELQEKRQGLNQKIQQQQLERQEAASSYQFGGDLTQNRGNIQKPVINSYDGNANTHQQGVGGIPVDARGNPVTTSKQSAVGLTEKGEVTWNGYVFSDKLKV